MECAARRHPIGKSQTMGRVRVSSSCSKTVCLLPCTSKTGQPTLPRRNLNPVSSDMATTLHQSDVSRVPPVIHSPPRLLGRLSLSPRASFNRQRLGSRLWRWRPSTPPQLRCWPMPKVALLLGAGAVAHDLSRRLSISGAAAPAILVSRREQPRGMAAAHGTQCRFWKGGDEHKVAVQARCGGDGELRVCIDGEKRAEVRQVGWGFHGEGSDLLVRLLTAAARIERKRSGGVLIPAAAAAPRRRLPRARRHRRGRRGLELWAGEGFSSLGRQPFPWPGATNSLRTCSLPA